MKIKVQVVIEAEDGSEEIVEEVTCLNREELSPEELGLTLAETKDLLQGVQQTMVTQQIADYLKHQFKCPSCGQNRSLKGNHSIVYRSLFGKLRLPSPRFYRCCKEMGNRNSFSPLSNLLQERTAPELLYLETKWASLMSYGVTVNLLSEVLPLEGKINTRSVHRKLQQMAQRVENELGKEEHQYINSCPAMWEKLPRPDQPLIVGLDGGYVHSKDAKSRQKGWFEVIAGKSIKPDEGSKCFAFVNRYDTKPKRRLYEVLKSQGMQLNQQVTFLSDGGDTVRDLQLYLNPQAEHLLDWFHITMRLTVMKQMAKGLKTKDLPTTPAELEKTLDRIKWCLWHGNVFKALQKVESLEMDLESIEEISAEQNKLYKAVSEFSGYIRANASFIPNYGDRYRNGGTISTAFVESTVNQVISKRFVKKQQMRWTEKGAHLLLQVRTKTLNNDLRKTFCQWYPKMKEAA